jgi:hypothetical protein
VSPARGALSALAVAGLFLSGCDLGRSVAPPPADVAPVASTPAGAVQRLAWACDHQDVHVVRGLLSDDFLAVTAALDSAGSGARDSLSTRGGELARLLLLLEGPPRPASVRLLFDANLAPFDDNRPGKNPRWHKQIRTSVELVVVDSSSQHTRYVSGHALFYLTRGDSALIPPDQSAVGVLPDSSRWWLAGWEDETIGAGGSAVSNATRPAPPAVAVRTPQAHPRRRAG